LIIRSGPTFAHDVRADLAAHGVGGMAHDVLDVGVGTVNIGDVIVSAFGRGEDRVQGDHLRMPL
jgi:hypothetical protein